MNNAYTPAHPTGNSQSSIGLTKREYFAGQALTGLMASDMAPISDYEGAAKRCVTMADALLAELEKTQS